MKTRTRTLLTVCLPALILPLMLAASSTAEAANLSISNGFRSAKDLTAVGFDFSLDGDGTAVLGGNSYATSISLDCTVDNTNEALDCVGIMTLGNAQADIVLDVHGDTEEVRWALEEGAPAAFEPIHELWGGEVVTAGVTLPGGWSARDYFINGEWGYWYYSTTWAETYTSITGNAGYPEVIW